MLLSSEAPSVVEPASHSVALTTSISFQPFESVTVVLHCTKTVPQEDRAMLSEVVSGPTTGLAPNIDTLEMTSSPITRGMASKTSRDIPKITP